MLVETCANMACRADQKPASHSQLSLLIMACATGVNHIIIPWIYSYSWSSIKPALPACLIQSIWPKHCCCISSKRLNKEKEDQLLERLGNPVAADLVKTEVFSASVCLGLENMDTWASLLGERDQGGEQLPAIDEG